MELFDALLPIGRTNDALADAPWDEAGALAAMDRFDVSEALALSTIGPDGEPDVGNEVTRRFSSPRLHRVWVLDGALPARPAPRDALRQALESGARALLVNPATRDIRIERSQRIREAATLMEERRVPLLVAYSAWDRSEDIIDWYGLAEFCRAFPRLPVIAWQLRSRSNRPLFDALAEAPNLRVVVSSLWQAQMVECICETYGADRLVASLGLPRLHPGAFANLLDYSDISGEDRALIAHGNLRRLLREADYRIDGHPTAPPPKTAAEGPAKNPVAKKSGGEIAARFRAGKPLDHVPVIDFHGHLGNSGCYYFVPRGSTEEMMAYFDRLGVAGMVIFPFALTSDVRAANAHVQAECARYPRRLYPLTTLHARFPQDWTGLLAEGHARGARGIKLISSYQCVPDANMDWSPALEFARGKGWVVLNHAWASLDRLGGYARNFPDVTFILGHFGIGTGKMTDLRTLLETQPNVYQCTCAHFACAPAVTAEQMVEQLPVEKILYGSDALDLDLATGIGPIALADIPERTKERILGGNAVDLMKRLGWPEPAWGPTGKAKRRK